MVEKNKSLKIKQVNIDEIHMADYNPRQLTKNQYKYLKDSIYKFGLVDPLIININQDRKNILVGGHQRLRIAKKLGFKSVPCVEVNLSFEKERELNVRLNKNVGSWDFDSLANFFDIDELFEWGFKDEELFSFDKDYSEEFSLPDGDKSPYQQMTFTVSDEQAEIIKEKIKLAKKNDFGETGNKNNNGNALWWICQSYE